MFVVLRSVAFVVDCVADLVDDSCRVVVFTFVVGCTRVVLLFFNIVGVATVVLSVECVVVDLGVVSIVIAVVVGFVDVGVVSGVVNFCVVVVLRGGKSGKGTFNKV